MNTEIKHATRKNYLENTRYYRELCEELVTELDDCRLDFICNMRRTPDLMDITPKLADEVKAMLEPEYVIEHVMPYAYALREVLKHYEVWLTGGYTLPGGHLYEDFTVRVRVTGETLRMVDAAAEIDWRDAICNLLPQETGCPYNVKLTSYDIGTIPHAIYLLDDESARMFDVGEDDE